MKDNLAPQVGLEPTTLRLTAGCSAIELLRSGKPLRDSAIWITGGSGVCQVALRGRSGSFSSCLTRAEQFHYFFDFKNRVGHRGCHRRRNGAGQVIPAEGGKKRSGSRCDNPGTKKEKKVRLETNGCILLPTGSPCGISGKTEKKGFGENAWLYALSRRKFKLERAVLAVL